MPKITKRCKKFQKAAIMLSCQPILEVDILVLDIFLTTIALIGGCLCALWAHNWECGFSRIKICIGFTLPTIGEYVSFRGCLAPFGRGFWECEFLEYTFVLDLHCQQLGNMCQLEGAWGMCIFKNIHLCYFLVKIFSCLANMLGKRQIGH